MRRQTSQGSEGFVLDGEAFRSIGWKRLGGGGKKMRVLKLMFLYNWKAQLPS